ncbi:thiamine pyrophosphate-binding protein [Marinilabiliaceae bacterium JC017]|nr:thiamine pyrophosphate-binding protein [Marinilabiliaceae bacterium JC017]
MKVIDAFMQQLICDRQTIIFGNPGTTEEVFLDVLTNYSQIKYIKGLQESVVVGMADGYARAVQKPGIVQLHGNPGLGNAMAILYQAHRSFTPLVVFAGEAYNKDFAFDGFLGGDTSKMAEPVTKWSYRITSPGQFLRVWRRALKVAMTPPYGPVYLGIPMDIFEGETTEEITPVTYVNTNVRPEEVDIQAIADAILQAKNPLMLIGDGVSMSGARDGVESLSAITGMPIYGVDYGDLNVGFDFPLFMGLIGHTSGHTTRKITYDADVVLSIGTPLFPELFPSDQPYFNRDAKVFQIDLNTWELAKNFSVTKALAADPRQAVTALIKIIQEKITPAFSKWVTGRCEWWNQKKKENWQSQDKKYGSPQVNHALPVALAMQTIVNSMPQDTIVYDESITSTDELLHYLQPTTPGSYYLGRGGCIGVGWPGAIGCKVANPDQPVLAFSGDGSSLYIIQCLWTAAHYNLKMVFVLLNNRSYRILKVNLLNYWAEHNIEPRPFPEMDLTQPDVDYTKVAEGFGVKGFHADDLLSLKDALWDAWASDGPALIDVRISGSVDEELREVVRSLCGCA